jgi:ribonuclease HI
MLVLEKLAEMGLQGESILIHGDSQLVINQMWGSWNMNKGAYIETAMKCRELLRQFSSTRGKWVQREQNERADELSKRALLAVGITPKVRR